jgi:hypothetical protein
MALIQDANLAVARSKELVKDPRLEIQQIFFIEKENEYELNLGIIS